MPTSLIVNTLEYETHQFYTVQKQTEEEEAEEETKGPEPTEAMDIEQEESAAVCWSLSLMSKKAIFHRQTPPCHQTTDLSNREESQQDGNGKSVNLMEANMLIISANEVGL
jgi:hypothetical protein